jgi:hypothetical protein
VSGILINLSSLDNPYAFLRPLEYRGFATWGTSGSVATSGTKAMRYILYNAAPSTGLVQRFYGPTWTWNSDPLFSTDTQARITAFTDFNELTGTAANIAGNVTPWNAKWAVQLQVWSDSDSFIPLNDATDDQCSLSINTWA